MIVGSRHSNPKIAKCGAKLSNTVTCVACHIKIFGQGSGRSLAGANPSSKTFLWDFGGGWRLGRWRWLVVGAPGARIRALALFFCGGWRSGRGGARIRAHKLLGESEPRDWRCRSGRESEPTNFWANPSSGIGAADRQSEPTNFWARIRACELSPADGSRKSDIFGGWCVRHRN